MTQVLVGEYIRSLSRTGPSLYIFSFKKANWQKWSRMMGDSCVPWSGERESESRREREKNKRPIYLSLLDCIVYARLYGVVHAKERRKRQQEKGSLERVRALTYLSTFLLLWSICNRTTTTTGDISPFNTGAQF